MDHIRKRLQQYTLVDDDDPKKNQVSTRSDIAWKGVCLVMTVFLVLSAYVQLNDPDPWLWIPAYIIPALLTVAVIFKRDVIFKIPWKITCDVSIFLSAINALYLFMVVTGILKENFVNPLEHEEGRELGGTMIVIIWLLVLRNTSLESFDSNTRMLTAVTVLVGILSLIPLVVWAACFHRSGSNLGHCKDMFPGMLGDKFKQDL